MDGDPRGGLGGIHPVDLRVERHADPFAELGQVGTAQQLRLQRRQCIAALDGGDGEGEGQAELGGLEVGRVQPVVEVDEGGEGIHMHARDVRGLQAVIGDQAEEGVQPRMHETAAGVRLDVGAVDKETAAQLIDDAAAVVEQRQVQGIGVGGEAGRGQVHGKEAGGHRPADALLDVGAAETVQVRREQAGRVLLGDEQGLRHGCGGQRTQPRSRRRHRDRRPAAGGDAQMGVHVARRGNAHPRVVGEDDRRHHLGTRGPGLLGRGQRRRNDRGPRMPEGGTVAVVDVERLHRHGVGEGGT